MQAEEKCDTYGGQEDELFMSGVEKADVMLKFVTHSEYVDW